MAETAFGIDFGTTHTRLAYFNGERLDLVAVRGVQGNPYQIPTLVRYTGSVPSAYGHAARTAETGSLPADSIKWLLDRDDPVEINGHVMDPCRVASDFLRHLKDVAKKYGIQEPLSHSAVTVPVKYPPRARQNLLKAFDLAGIQVTHLFYEPVAALYCCMAAHPTNGVAAVFDWGGGTLDIATVRAQDGFALVQELDGLHRGGETFDRLLCHKAVDSFLATNPCGLTADDILDRTNSGQEVRLLAEQAKIRLSTESRAPIERLNFVAGKALHHWVTRNDFESWISEDIDQALASLKRVLKRTGISETLVSLVLLSGGTCNIPAVQMRIRNAVGSHRVFTRLDALREMFTTNARPAFDDLGNATAMGAALLAVRGAKPIFAKDVGIRLATSDTGGETFYPIFKAGESISGQAPREERVFITYTDMGVARILICERGDAEHEPNGRLLRILPVPIDRQETWVNLKFEMAAHLSLKVSAGGVIARSHAETVLNQISVGFNLPSGGAKRDR